MPVGLRVTIVPPRRDNEIDTGYVRILDDANSGVEVARHRIAFITRYARTSSII
jgi:hypothetical protein